MVLLARGPRRAGPRRGPAHGPARTEALLPLLVSAPAEAVIGGSAALAPLHEALRAAGRRPREVTLVIKGGLGEADRRALLTGVDGLRAIGYLIAFGDVGAANLPLDLLADASPYVLVLSPGMIARIPRDPRRSALTEAPVPGSESRRSPYLSQSMGVGASTGAGAARAWHVRGHGRARAWHLRGTGGHGRVRERRVRYTGGASRVGAWRRGTASGCSGPYTDRYAHSRLIGVQSPSLVGPFVSPARECPPHHDHRF